MSGRMKASLVAALGNLLPLLSPATVALVVLRKGLGEGVLVLLWAALPLLVLLYRGGMNETMAWSSLLSLLVVLFGARVLAQTGSWSFALKVMLGISLCCGLAVQWLLADSLLAVRAALVDMIKQMQDGVAGTDPAQVSAIATDAFLSGLLAWVMALSAVAALLLARWWQALLYNPGGFREEFHQLRLSKIMAVALFAALLACYVLGSDYVPWGNLLGLPLLLSGVALVHYTVAFAKRGTHWLVIFYMALVFLLGPLSSVLVGLGLLDSLLDFRARMGARGSKRSE